MTVRRSRARYRRTIGVSPIGSGYSLYAARLFSPTHSFRIVLINTCRTRRVSDTTALTAKPRLYDPTTTEYYNDDPRARGRQNDARNDCRTNRTRHRT